MNLFEFFLNLNNANKESWIETNATFTGKRNIAKARTKVGYIDKDYYEYEITYNVGSKKQSAYYTFYPLPDPDICDIKGQVIKIKYNEKKPYRWKIS